MSARPPGVLFVLNSLRPGGAERHVISLANCMDAAKFRLSLAYLKSDATLLPDIDAGRLESVFCCNVQGKFSWRAVGALARHIDEHEIDLIVCTNTYSMLYGLLARARARRRAKVVTVFHTTLPGSTKSRLLMAFYKPLFGRCDLVVYVCENQRRYWRARGITAAPDVVVFNGIDTERFRDRYAPEEKAALRARLGFGERDYVVGLCAVMRPEKAHGDLLQALVRVRARGIDAKALFIGDGPERSRIEAMIADLGLTEHVRLAGFQADPRPYVACCDVMALVSHAVETFSLAALESMALGKPLVMSRTGGADEQVTDRVNGLLFEARDIEQLANHLAALQAAGTREPMARAAVRIVRERFTIERMLAGFTEQFERALTR